MDLTTPEKLVTDSPVYPNKCGIPIPTCLGARPAHVGSAFLELPLFALELDVELLAFGTGTFLDMNGRPS